MSEYYGVPELDEDDRTHPCPESIDLLQINHLKRFADDTGVLHFTESQCHEHAGLFCRASCNYPFLFERFCDLLRDASSEFGFSELSRTKQRQDSNHIVVEKTITKGLFVSEDLTTAIWTLAISDEALPRELISIRDGSAPVDHTFKGEYYYLARLLDQVFAYDVYKYKNVEQLINRLKQDFDTPIEYVGVDVKTGVLVIRSSWMIAALSRINSEGLEEDERVILSERLKESQPFFEFKAPIEVNWAKLNDPRDDTFQEICRRLLLKEPGIDEVIPIGKTRAADRGRDLEVRQKVKGLIDSSTIKWLVQCKFSSRSISPDAIKGWTDRVREHGYDGFWLMTNNDITPDLFDHFKGVERHTNIKIKFWQRGDFHTKLNVYSEILKSAQFFNQSDPESGIAS